MLGVRESAAWGNFYLFGQARHMGKVGLFYYLIAKTSCYHSRLGERCAVCDWARRHRCQDLHAIVNANLVLSSACPAGRQTCKMVAWCTADASVHDGRCSRSASATRLSRFIFVLFSCAIGLVSHALFRSAPSELSTAGRSWRSLGLTSVSPLCSLVSLWQQVQLWTLKQDITPARPRRS